MILANNLQTFWDTISCNKKRQKASESRKNQLHQEVIQMAKNYETDRNESNYAGKNYGESDFRNCGKNSSKNSSRNCGKNSSKNSYGNSYGNKTSDEYDSEKDRESDRY